MIPGKVNISAFQNYAFGKAADISAKMLPEYSADESMPPGYTVPLVDAVSFGKMRRLLETGHRLW